MKNEIYKITAKEIIKMIENVDYIEEKEYILELSNNQKIPIWDFNDLLDTDEGICIYTRDKNIVKIYQNGLKMLDNKKGS